MANRGCLNEKTIKIDGDELIVLLNEGIIFFTRGFRANLKLFGEKMDFC